MDRHTKINFRNSFFTVLTLLLSPMSWAADTASDSTDRCNGATESLEPVQHGWYFTWENDVAGVIKSDDYYTQGAQLGYTFKYKQDDPSVLQRIHSPLCWLFGFKTADKPGKKALSASSMYLGQQLYTPHDTSTILPIPTDRPYAGWAYLGFRQELLQPLQSSPQGHRRWSSHSLDLQLGVVGPSALGEQTQRKAHNLDNDALSNGWQNQITDRFGAQAFYNFSKRMYSAEVGPAIFDMLATGGVAYGNVQQSLDIGGLLRFGRNMGPILPRAVNPSPFTASMMPIEGDSDDNMDSRHCGLLFHAQECYVFAGVTARGVRHNMFLEPAASGAGAIISPEPFVYELNWGVRVRYNWVRLDYVSTIRSREFKPAPANPLEKQGRHDFGSLTVSCYGHFGNNSGKFEWVCPGVVGLAAAFLVFR